MKCQRETQFFHVKIPNALQIHFYYFPLFLCCGLTAASNKSPTQLLTPNPWQDGGDSRKSESEETYGLR